MVQANGNYEEVETEKTDAINKRQNRDKIQSRMEKNRLEQKETEMSQEEETD